MDKKDLFENNGTDTGQERPTNQGAENSGTALFNEATPKDGALFERGGDGASFGGEDADDADLDALLKNKAQASETQSAANDDFFAPDTNTDKDFFDEASPDDDIFDKDPEFKDGADTVSDDDFFTQDASEGDMDFMNAGHDDIPPQKKRGKKPWIIAGCILGLLIIAYLGAAFYFKGHYFVGTTMNGIDVSGKTAAEVETLLQNSAASHSLTLKERGGQTETLNADQIHMQYVDDGAVEQHLAGQNIFAWPMGLIPQKAQHFEATFACDEDKLNASLSALNALAEPNITKVENAHPVYEGNAFTVKPEVTGNELDQKLFKETVKDAILAGKQELDLDAEGCYKKPAYTKDSPEVQAAADTMNKYIKSVVTYTFGDQQEVLDSATIAGWLGVDDKMQVTINNDAVSDYVIGLSDKYDTYGTSRSFTTSGGANITVSGGDYGWLIDTDEETAALISIIQAGTPVTREPVYAKTAVSHGARDFGDTYVEISLSAQNMWFYKNGSLIVSTPVVTGSVAGGYATPAGVYDLDYKATDVTLSGPGYASPVTFWLPYGGDIGIHDASWRSQFGGNIYLTGGSHGCVNTPYAAVQQIYNNIEDGDPVIVY